MLSLQLRGSLTARCVKPALSAGAIGLAHPVFLHKQSFAIGGAVLAEKRPFSSTARSQLREVFPEYEGKELIRKTKPAWPHPGYTEEQLRSPVVGPAHRPPRNFSDRWALNLVKFARWCMDTATGFKYLPKTSDPNTPMTNLDERGWLMRLESIAGVPGMVAGMLRHLHSLRRLKRDNGWIETLLEESYNERMHLLTFMRMAEPGWFMKMMIICAQGVFFNSLFVSYLVSPKTCHRFVGYLEEEAIKTYTVAIHDLEVGALPHWSDPSFRAPDIAVNYWRMPEGHRTMLDLILYVRADESKHREVNHTLGNLQPNTDPNPFVSEYKDEKRPHPSKGLESMKPTGWERDEVI
ncbi:alternative oxidase [Paecilomyces variotii No. 5]|uniref:Alternative oxidase n=1 Tax=Byssochlamys spectabilis (strain No. 5 / NBRC 109023) TaxID=1356009 RepID=V5I4Q7_BYSSN|nr:alternative oxidase [Paecilomyces variotii No. 5]